MNREKYMFKILKSIINKESMESVEQYIIYPGKRGYVMYGEYIVKTPISGEYIVEKCKSYTTKTFNNLRNAIIWVTLDQSNKIMYCKQIEDLDRILASIDSNIKVQKNLLSNSKNLQTISLAYTKIAEETNKRNYLLQELDYLVYYAKSLQEQKFNKLTK